jgi:hypothetical protein
VVVVLLEEELDEDELLLELEELLEEELDAPLVLDEELEELDDVLLEDEELDEELEELLELPVVVVGAYEHQAEVTPAKAPPKFELEQATLLVKVPKAKLPALPRAT